MTKQDTHVYGSFGNMLATLHILRNTLESKCSDTGKLERLKEHIEASFEGMRKSAEENEIPVTSSLHPDFLR